MRRKIWKGWHLTVREGLVERVADGQLNCMRPSWQTVFKLSPSEARRLFQKLSGDYKD